MYRKFVIETIIYENDDLQENNQIKDNKKTIELTMKFVLDNQDKLIDSKKEIEQIIDYFREKNPVIAKKMQEHAEIEQNYNYKIINNLYKIKHKENMPANVTEALKGYSYVISFSRDIVLYPNEFKELLGEKNLEITKLHSQITKLINADKNTTLKLSKEFINRMEDVVKDVNDEKVKESFKRMFNKHNSKIVSEDVKTESLKDFIKDIYRLPFKILFKPFAKVCYSFVMFASSIITKMLKPFVEIINKVTNFFTNYIPKKFVDALAKAGIIKNPIIGTIIETGFKFAIPFALQGSLFFFKIFTPRSSMLLSYISSIFSLSKTIKSVNLAASTVQNIGSIGGFVSSFNF